MLSDRVEAIEAGDVVFVPAGAVHQIANFKNDGPLRVAISRRIGGFRVVE